jgi:hypothetical protein
LLLLFCCSCCSCCCACSKPLFHRSARMRFVAASSLATLSAHCAPPLLLRFPPSSGAQGPLLIPRSHCRCRRQVNRMIAREALFVCRRAGCNVRPRHTLAKSGSDTAGTKVKSRFSSPS